MAVEGDYVDKKDIKSMSQYPLISIESLSLTLVDIESGPEPFVLTRI